MQNNKFFIKYKVKNLKNDNLNKKTTFNKNT